MIGTGLERSLKMVAERLYKLRVLRRQALCWLLLLVPGIALVMLLPKWPGLLPTNLLVLLAITIVGLMLARWKLPRPTTLEAARLVEKNRPELNDAVLTAVRASETLRTQRNASVLNERVIDEADRLARSSDWRSVVPRRQMLGWSALSFLAFGFLITGVVAAGRWGRELPSQLMLPEVSGNVASIGATDLAIDPGDVELEQGSPLTVVARFGRTLPTDVMLQLRSDSQTAAFVMEPTVDEGVFAVRIPHVDSDGSYCVAFGNSSQELTSIDGSDFRNKSQDFRIQTYIRPRLQQADVLITPPAYTGKDPLLVEDTVRVTVVEGSQVQYMLHLNKSVAVAELRGKDQTVVPLLAVDVQSDAATVSATVSATVEAIEDQKYTLYLEDAQGRTSAEEVILSLKVTRNQRPKIKVTFPGKDTSVSPLQEFQIEAQATDDFGFTDFGVIYTLSGQAAQELSLHQDTAAAGADAALPSEASADVARAPAVTSVKLQHQIDLETLHAAPDELLSYYFYVEDTAADGSVRRTHSDMMFAEVRRFEEIFRESQQQQSQQQQQQQQQGNQTEKLMELQRQIMVATWNVQRSLEESRSRESAVRSAVQDVDVVRQSQLQALQMLEEVKAAAEEPAIQEIVAGVERDMRGAVQSLQEFIDQQTESALPDALPAEQSAFAGLMRLRAKEHEVTRSQSSSGSGQGQNSASQEQLRQLELDNDRNRYESEKQAQQQQEQQNAEQQEQLQILNRLKELARRQEMLNERMKQLESELRMAETQQEKDEIERELKRLRDEQREMLRDVDELRETMDQQSTEQQQRNQESRQQVEQARERVQEASRAMDEGRLSEAISEGTRAERQFEQLQEEFRNQTSSQFSEAMRDLREQARQMNERQDQIAKELSGESDSAEESANPTKPSLRSDRDRESLQQKVAEQRDDLERVLEQAKSLVEEAEASEPLLSRRLYDTIRETRDRKPEEALEATEILVSRGLWNQGQQAEQIAREGIAELSKGIEKAADAVLGSEAEALRRAQAEIEDLTQQLSSEIAQATGQKPGAEPGESEAGRAGSQGSQDAGDPNSERTTGEPSQRGESPSGESQREGSQAESPGKGAAGQGEPQEGQPRAGGEPSQSGDNREGQSPQQDSENPPGENSSGSSPPGQEAQQGEGQGQQPGQQSPGQQQPGQQSPSQSGQGQGESSERSSESGGQSSSGQARSQSGSRNGGGQNSLLMGGGRETSGGAEASQARPLTGDEFREWSNRLREVEEVLNDPELSQQVAQVRDRARSIRAEFRRHGTEPQWDLVKSQLLDEMTSLQKRIQQELAKLSSDRSMVPIDREPVPEEFDELVRRYYELLGQNREESQ